MSTSNLDTNDKESIAIAQTTAKIDIYYGSEKKEEARCIPQANVVSVKIVESMFSSLPTIKLVLNDTGNMIHNLGFQHGGLLLVTITPELGDPDKLPTPYVNSKFRIEGIDYVFNTARNDYDYHISGIYAAETYLNCKFTWPPETMIASPDFAFVKNLGTDIAYVKTGGFTSVELLERVVPKGGLAFMSEVSTDDRMYWLNDVLTYYEFVKYVVAHAWISEDDCPIFYVNVNGVGVLSSLKTLQSNASLITYKEKDRSTLIGNISTSDHFRMYNNPILKNAGYLQNEGGYKVEASVWNPYHKLCINPTPQAEAGNTKKGSRLPPRIRTIPLPKPEYGHDRHGENDTQTAYIAKMSNKSSESSSNLRYCTNDIYFPETHQYYDYAPLHNLSLKKAFFNVFLYLSVDCSAQLDFDAKRKRRETLGDKITVDFANTQYNNSIQSGDFIIGSIMHYWSKIGTYQQVIGCVSDGINGFELNKREKK